MFRIHHLERQRRLRAAVSPQQRNRAHHRNDDSESAASPSPMANSGWSNRGWLKEWTNRSASSRRFHFYTAGVLHGKRVLQPLSAASSRNAQSGKIS
jgi:hypothetical protein